MYHLSAPMTSLKPSLLLSLPRRRDELPCGTAMLPAPPERGEWMVTLADAGFARGVVDIGAAEADEEDVERW